MWIFYLNFYAALSWSSTGSIYIEMTDRAIYRDAPVRKELPRRPEYRIPSSTPHGDRLWGACQMMDAQTGRSPEHGRCFENRAQHSLYLYLY